MARPKLPKVDALPAVGEPDQSAELKKMITRWLMNPVAFFEECLRVRLSNQQKELVETVCNMYRVKKLRALGVKMTDAEVELAGKIGISVHSGKGGGKGFCVAGLIIWFMMTFDNFKGIVTANSQAQIEDVLSNEIRLLLKGSPMDLSKIIDVNSKRILKKGKVRGDETNFLAKRTCSIRRESSASAEVLQGYHAPNMLFVVDEASGPPDGVFAPLTSTLSDPMNVVILIGNPTKYTGYFWKTHYDSEERKRWVQLRWDLEESDIHTIKPGMKEYIASQLGYGRDSNAFRVNVLGLPPLSDNDCLIPMSWIWDCVRDGEDFDGVEEDKTAGLVVGVDPGRTGDATTILKRRGNYVYDDIIERVSNDTMVVADWVADCYEAYHPDAICLDFIGLGLGVGDKLSRDGIPHCQVSVSKAAARNDRFLNLRAELYFYVRSLFEARKISIPKNEKLIYELGSMKIKTLEPKAQLYSKAEMLGLGLKSPNLADALMISYYVKHLQSQAFSKSDRYRDDDDDDYGFDQRGWMTV